MSPWETIAKFLNSLNDAPAQAIAKEIGKTVAPAFEPIGWFPSEEPTEVITPQERRYYMALDAIARGDLSSEGRQVAAQETLKGKWFWANKAGQVQMSTEPPEEEE